MFFRTSKVKGRVYLQLVENNRENGKVKQRLIYSFGLLGDAIDKQLLDKLILSAEKFCPNVICLHENNNANILPITRLIFGPTLVFRKIWLKLGISTVINQACKDNKPFFPLGQVLFASTLQRLMEPDSDLACSTWLKERRIHGRQDFQDRDVGRAAGWLGLPLVTAAEASEPEVFPELPYAVTGGQATTGSDDQSPVPAKTVRRVKDLLEEKIFARRVNPPTNPEMAFFGATSGLFRARSASRPEPRPDGPRSEFHQVVLGMAFDDEGFPICTEFWPGAAVDAATLAPVAERLAARFGFRRVCLVAERGMISGSELERLSNTGWSYLLGERTRFSAETRDLSPEAATAPEVGKGRPEPAEPAGLRVEREFVEGDRRILCRDEALACKDKLDRETTVAGLEKALKSGDKSYIGANWFNLYLKDGLDNFELDYKKVTNDTKHDGKFILRTNLKVNAADILLRYKRISSINSIIKNNISYTETRPICHQIDADINWHNWMSFLALVLRAYVEKALLKNKKVGENNIQWQEIVNSLMNLDYSIINNQSIRYSIRSKTSIAAERVFRALNINQPNVIKML